MTEISYDEISERQMFSIIEIHLFNNIFETMENRFLYLQKNSKHW